MLALAVPNTLHDALIKRSVLAWLLTWLQWHMLDCYAADGVLPP